MRKNDTPTENTDATPTTSTTPNSPLYDIRLSELVLFQNHQLLVASKPVGIPTQADTTGDKPLHLLLEQYCKHPLYIVNRIDRPVSGLVVFAKTKQMLSAVVAQWQQRTVVKTYLAVVQHRPPKDADTLRHYLRKGRGSSRTVVFDTEAFDTAYSDLSYRLLAASDKYFLLEIKLHTGRHHQIRSQLSHIGCPIKGDVKYGARRANPDRSIHLHAWKLDIALPSQHEPYHFETAPPNEPLWNYFAAQLDESAK